MTGISILKTSPAGPCGTSAARKVLREYFNDGTWVVESDYRDAQLLAAETRQGRRHYHPDHLGTPRLITNQVGYPVAYHVYYPFGERRPPSTRTGRG